MYYSFVRKALTQHIICWVSTIKTLDFRLMPKQDPLRFCFLGWLDLYEKYDMPKLYNRIFNYS